jgi:AraC family transcriptional regulator
MSAPQINPRAPLLGKLNAILSGTSTRYSTPDFAGSLSVKTVLQGEAVWQAANRRFRVTPGSYLVLQDRQVYSLGIDAARPVTTFCVFFRRGFVEDILRCSTLAEGALLDNPRPSVHAPLDFPERLDRSIGPIENCLLDLRRKSLSHVTDNLIDEDFLPLAHALLRAESALHTRVSQIPAARAATRREVLRRLLRGRDFLLASIGDRCSLDHMAKAAGLSPFHFHRAFKAAFRQTPHAYLTAARLHHAAELLQSGRHSVTETCLECGFTSLGSFSSLFHRTFGVSPAAFQKSRRPFRKIGKAAGA